MAQRVTQLQRVTLTDNPAAVVRVSQLQRVVLTDNPSAVIRVSQLARIVLVSNTAPDGAYSETRLIGAS